MEVNVNEQQIVMLAGMWVSIHGDRFKGEGGGDDILRRSKHYTLNCGCLRASVARLNIMSGCRVCV